MRKLKSLKTRLIMYFTASTIVLSVAINFFYYTKTKESLKKNMIDGASSNVYYITDNIERQLEMAGQLSDWIFVNRSLNSLSQKNYKGMESPYDDEIRKMLDVLNDQVMNSYVSQKISSLLIVLDNGIDLRTGIDANLIDKKQIQAAQWYVNGMSRKGALYWNTIVENPAQCKTDNYILPLVRPIISAVSGNPIGWSFIGFKENLISDVYKKFNPGNGNIIYVINTDGKCVSHQNPDMIGKSLIDETYVQNILKQGKGFFDAKIKDRHKLIVFNKFKTADWIVVEELSYGSLQSQSSVLLNSTLFVILISVLISFALTVYLSSNLTNPLKKLQNQMRSISGGNFEREITIEGTDEIGELGKGINEMTSNIKALMESKLHEEGEKRRLELMLLQSQINPHFLYNTLNSIKWIASIQKADGISNAVSALGMLLKNIAKGTSEKITIKEELDLVEAYIFIQNIRYMGKIRLLQEVESELLECRIVKFTLQPIVENAIFHGIEPKREAGRIRIKVSRADEEILICVEDDGVGMSVEQIKGLFSDPYYDKIRGFSAMGVKNVDDRIKLTYGKTYGLDITSEEGIFTLVKIRIPFEK